MSRMRSGTSRRHEQHLRVAMYIHQYKEALMRTISFSESRANYARTLDAVVNDREEVVITRAGREPVVIVSLEDYESLKETAYLLRDPENAARILRSIERLEGGGGVERPLVE
jgi:antitoxin YefM